MQNVSSLRNQLYCHSSVKYDPLSLYDKFIIFKLSSNVKGTLKSFLSPRIKFDTQKIPGATTIKI